MIYTFVLLFFGLLPLLALWIIARMWIGRYVGLLFWLVLMIVFVGASWESVAIDRIWFYAPGTTFGVRLLNIPLEEWAYYVLDALIVGTLAVALSRALARHGVRKNVRP